MLPPASGPAPTSAYVLPVLMLFGSNTVMNLAWYGHLKYENRALSLVVLASWGIAFFEYWLAVPANRIGSAAYSLAQLKTLQEVASLSTFVAFAFLYFGQRPSVSTLAGFALIALGAFCVFRAPFG